MVRHYFIETFGCQMNEHDSEKIAGLLEHHGLLPAASPEEADLFLLNTCSIREKAAQKVYSRLGAFKGRKAVDPRFRLGVVGCVAQQAGRAMLARAPFIDLVVGTHQYHTIPDLLEELDAARGKESLVATRFLPDGYPVEMPRVRRQSTFRAAVTIMEGCNKHCAFCIVPYTRGQERNRPARTILEEVKRAVDQGFVEILLLGQTVNSYRDPEHPRRRFADLLGRVASLPGVRRLRFTSPHPREFDEETIALIHSMPNISSQVHLPLQSGSTRVLKRMHRQYTREGFLQLVEKFQSGPRRLAFSTDVIVGFPGETESDFEETLSLVEQIQFESMFSFKYSPRPGTEAAAWEDEVPEEEKTRRLMVLQRLQKGIQWRLHRQHYLDRTFEILVEGTARDGERRSGRTLSNKVVNFPGPEEAGSFVRVLVTEAGPHSLMGRKVEENVEIPA